MPNRFARLIEYSTRDKQAERLDVSQILAELERLQVAEVDATRVDSAELLAEEVLARAQVFHDYAWNLERLEGMVNLPGGVRLIVGGDETRRRVVTRLTWVTQGFDERKNIGKYIPEKLNQAAASLRRGGWTIETSDRAAQSALVMAVQDVAQLRQSLPVAAESVAEATAKLKFE
jgi:hypothetical protein